MAGRKSFDDDAFRALLGSTLEKIEVSDALRDRTLAACRAMLAKESSQGRVNPEEPVASSPDGASGADAVSGMAAVSGVDAVSGMATVSGNEEAARKHGILPFAARHARAFRIAGGIAACLVLVVALRGMMGQMNHKAFSMPMMDSAAAPAASMAGSGAAAPESEGMAEASAAASAESSEQETKVADVVMGVVSAGTDANVVVSYSESLVGSGNGTTGADGNGAGGTGIDAQRTASPKMLPEPSASGSSVDGVNGASLAETAPQEGMLSMMPAPSPEADAGSLDKRNWQSYGDGSINHPVLERPTPVLLEKAIAAWTKGHGVDATSVTMETTRLFVAQQLAMPLTAGGISATSSLSRLAKETMGTDTGTQPGPVGIWMLPAHAVEGTFLVPVHVDADKDGGPSVRLGDPITVGNRDGWVETLSNETLLKKALGTAAGKVPDAWRIIDVNEGAGYWVSWTQDGTEFVMTFLDRPEEIGVENGRAYRWDSFVAMVSSFF